MSVYVVAQLRFTDKSRYRKYQASFPEVFARSGGRVLAADESPTVLEGECTGNKVVLMELVDEERALAFLNGPDYQRISEDRRAGADTPPCRCTRCDDRGHPREGGSADTRENLA